MKKAFGFREAVVVPEPSNPANTTKAIGVAAGMYITDNLTDDMSIGVGWGATLYESLQTLAQREMENVQVISLLGGIAQARRYNPSEFAWRLADRLNAECYLMAAPVFAPDAHTRQALVSHPGIKEIFRRAERLDLGCTDGKSVLIVLLESIVERLADILEAVARDVEALSR